MIWTPGGADRVDWEMSKTLPVARETPLESATAPAPDRASVPASIVVAPV
jgi:hypothetical protein